MLRININKGKRYVFKTHINEILLPRENAEIMEAFNVIIEPAKHTPLHVHDDTEQLYYVTGGSGAGLFVHPDGSKEEFEMAPGDVIHVPRNTQHQIFCTGAEPLTYLCVDGFPNGKPAHEPRWEDHYKAAKAKMEKQG